MHVGDIQYVFQEVPPTYLDINEAIIVALELIVSLNILIVIQTRQEHTYFPGI